MRHLIADSGIMWSAHLEMMKIPDRGVSHSFIALLSTRIYDSIKQLGYEVDTINLPYSKLLAGELADHSIDLLLSRANKP
jgi:hypothetical protein